MLKKTSENACTSRTQGAPEEELQYRVKPDIGNSNNANNYGIVKLTSMHLEVHARDYFDHFAHNLTVSGKALWLAYHGHRAEVPWTGNLN